ncbi:TenA family protein [Streptomyces sp. NPDC001262]|uniref:TenA family protein n=1 Tax=Streptomyces TaxID=1883 RepID=UPI00369509C8
MLLHEQLLEIADPVLRRVVDHPFWSGLRDGTLPPESLVYFLQQDTGHLLPAYGRALARCAAQAPDDAHAAFFARGALGTLEARDRLREASAGTAAALGIDWPAEQTPAGPATHAHCAFFTAAAATSPAAGMGAVLPMAWFNLNVSDNLAEHCTPGSRYEPWIRIYRPAEGYRHVVRKFLATADEIGGRCSESERRLLVETFTTGIRYEWAFAEASWLRRTWPI